MREMLFNMNDSVKVRLTEYGRNFLNTEYEREFAGNITRFPYAEIPTDEEGYTQFQLWVLAKQFGHLMHNGAKLAFDTEIKIVLDNTLPVQGEEKSKGEKTGMKQIKRIDAVVKGLTLPAKSLAARKARINSAINMAKLNADADLEQAELNYENALSRIDGGDDMDRAIIEANNALNEIRNLKELAENIIKIETDMNSMVDIEE